MSSESGKVVQKWADPHMFTAAPIDAQAGPRVYLLSMTPDPLGTIAAATMGYEGRNVHSLSEVSDDDRLRCFEQIQKTHLKAPFEFVQFHFLIEGVTRGFTHQMVRQRTATYVQESTRFAVKEDMPVGLPPSLAGTVEMYDHQNQLGWEFDREDILDGSPDYDSEPEAQRQRNIWDLAVEDIGVAYRKLVESGMPAEDARGLLPTNLLTRIQYRTDLRALIEHGGNRLCTQAQFEWRTVFSKIVEAIRNYEGVYDLPYPDGSFGREHDHAWQVEKIADVFRPICYLTGKCEFKASFDRPCSIRDRVDANASINRPSSDWGKEYVANRMPNPVRDPDNAMHAWPWAKRIEDTEHGFGEILRPMIPAINPVEWLADPGAAR